MKKHSVIHPSKTALAFGYFLLFGMPMSAIIAVILALCGVNQ
jgi:hypothetical protein